MEHTCHRCGAAIPEASPFCPQCGAPQIRVAASITEAPTPSDRDTGAVPVPTQEAAHARPPSFRRDRWISALIPGLLLGILAPILFAYLKLGYLLFLIGGGAIAVVLFRHRAPSAEVGVGAGAGLGALTGAISYVVYALIIAITAFVNIVVLRKGSEMAAELRRSLEQAMANNPDPQAQELIHKMMTPEGLAALMTIGLVLLLLVMLVSGAVGGMMGAAFGPKQQR